MGKHHSLYQEVELIKKDIHYYNFIKSIIRLFSVQFQRCVPQVDRYRIINTCGTGGNGIVYRVISLMDGQKYALKIPYLSYYMIDRYHLTIEHMHDDPYPKIDEIAEDLASLSMCVRAYPGIVRTDFYRVSEERSYKREYYSMKAVAGQQDMAYLVDYGTMDLICCQEGMPDEIRHLSYFVMPLFAGQPVPDYMESIPDPEQQWQQAVDLTGKAIELVDRMHHCRVLHRDLHPGNFLYQKEADKLNLIDFGSSLAECGSQELDTDGEKRGSKRFMPPEQFTDPRSADIRSDFFCLGGLLFFMLTSLSPFDRERQDDTQPRSPEEYIRKPDGLPDSLYTDIIAFLNRLMCFRKEDRFQSAEEIREAWLKLRKQLPEGV